MSFIDEYIDYASNLCDAPMVFHKFMARALVGVAVKNNVYFQFGANKIFPNFWMIYFAPSSKFRKSTSMRIGLRIIDHINADLRLPIGFSFESLWPILQERPCGFLFYSEFDDFVEGLSKKYMAQVESLLTDLYDVPDVPMVRKLRSDVFTIKQPTITILGATTPTGFFQAIKAADIERGFFPRWLVIYVTKKEREFDLPEPDMVVENNLIKKLHEIVVAVELNAKVEGQSEPKPINIAFTDDAKKEYIKWSQSFNKKINDASLLNASYYRLPTYVIKIAMVEALNDFNYEIKPAHLARALELIDLAYKSLVNLENNEIVSSDYQKMRKKVVDFIAAHPGGVTRTKLLRKVRFPPRDLNGVLTTLVESGEIVQPAPPRDRSSKKPVTHYVINESNVHL